MRNEKAIYDAVDVGKANLNIFFYIFVLISILGLILLVYQIKHKVSFSSKICPILLIVAFSTLSFFQIYDNIRINSVYEKYLKGNYEVVEGEITEYLQEDSTTHRGNCDYFYINDLEFSIPSMSAPWGYSLKQGDGGILRVNMRVKISYVKHTFENIIMRIEILE